MRAVPNRHFRVGLVFDAIKDRRLPAVILRPGQIFGQAAEKVPPFGTVALGGRWVVIGSGDLRLPAIYIEDLIDAMESAVSSEEVCGAVLQFVDPAQVAHRQYIEPAQLRNPVRARYAPRTVLYGLAVAVEGFGRPLHRNVPLTRYKVRSVIAPPKFECGAAAGSLGWLPRVGVKAGLNETFISTRKASEPVASSRAAVV